MANGEKKTGEKDKKMRWLRIVSSVTFLIIIFVFAVQPVAACHPVLDGNCVDIWVDVVAGTGTLNVTVDGNQVFNGPAQDEDHFQWSFEELNLEPCLVHNVVASYGGTTDNLSVGGGDCCEARLNISHVECFQACPPQIEVHFRLVHLPDNVLDYGAVTYSMTMPDNSVYNGTASFGGVTGDGAHYSEFINSSSANGMYNVTSANVTLTLVGGTLVIDLANPGPFEVTDCSCPPSGCNEPPSESGCEAGLIEYQGLCRDTNCPTESTCSCPTRPDLAISSSLWCDEEEGLWHFGIGVTNISINHSYLVKIRVGSERAEANLGPNHHLSTGDTAKEGKKISWTIRVSGEIFDEGSTDKLGPCGEETFVPEPGTVTLLGTGLSGLAGYIGLRRRLRK